MCVLSDSMCLLIGRGIGTYTDFRPIFHPQILCAQNYVPTKGYGDRHKRIERACTYVPTLPQAPIGTYGHI